MDYKALIRPALSIYFAVFMLALSAWAWAQPAAPVTLATAKLPEESIILYAEQCSNGIVLAQLDPEKRKLWRNGLAVANDGDKVPFCWIHIPHSPLGPVHYVVAENGAHGPFPVVFFDNKEVK
jgi:hypothetical protein